MQHILKNSIRSCFTSHNDNLTNPIRTNAENLGLTIQEVINFINLQKKNPNEYLKGSYSPTPTIIEAAISLYNNHNVEAITRNDADAINLNYIIKLYLKQ